MKNKDDDGLRQYDARTRCRLALTGDWQTLDEMGLDRTHLPHLWDLHKEGGIETRQDGRTARVWRLA